MATRDLHVVILGAGSTGLLIAQGLKKHGISFSVYEREDEHKYTHHQRDWSMGLLWGTDYIKNTLPDHLLDRFDEIRADPHDRPGPDRKGWLPFYDGKTAELVVKIPGGIAVRVSREKLRKFLSDEVEINFGKVSTNIEEHGDKVTVTFQDGTTATGDTVVCSDGIKGIGRSILLGSEKAALSTAPCTVVNTCNKYTAEQARFIRDSLDPVYKFAGHPDQPTLFLITSVDIPDLEHPEEWRIQLFLSTWGAKHAESNSERLRIFKEAASKYAEPWRSAALWLPDDTYIAPDHVRYWDNMVTWPNWNGKVTLAGDAAHPIMPFRAQGLNNALADANYYVASLVAVRNGQKTLADAITEYGQDALDRGTKEGKLSAAWGPTLHDWNAILNTPMMKQGYGKTRPTQQEDPKTEERPASSSSNSTQLTNEASERRSDVGSISTVSTTADASSPKLQPQATEPTIPASAPRSAVADANLQTQPQPQPQPQPLQTSLPAPDITPAALTPVDDSANTSALASASTSTFTSTVASTKASTPTSTPYTATTTSSPFDEEMRRLRVENQKLQKRNSWLMGRLEAIASLSSRAAGIDDDAWK